MLRPSSTALRCTYRSRNRKRECNKSTHALCSNNKLELGYPQSLILILYTINESGFMLILKLVSLVMVFLIARVKDFLPAQVKNNSNWKLGVRLLVVLLIAGLVAPLLIITTTQ